MFEGSTIVITGGSSGLGRELANRFVRRGANVAIVARDPEKLNKVREEIAASAGSGGRIEAFSCDVSDPAAVDAVMERIAGSMGEPDILINSAGILREGYFENQSIELFREIMGINYFGTLHCIKAVLPHFKKKGGGHIVNICSSGGLMGAFGYTAYCSSKFAVHGLTESLRSELKPQNVKIQIVCPPEFNSPMVEAVEANNRTVENREVVHTLPVLEIDFVATETIRGMEKGRYMIIPGFLTRIIELANRWSPALARAIVDFRIKGIYRGPSS